MLKHGYENTGVIRAIPYKGSEYLFLYNKESKDFYSPDFEKRISFMILKPKTEIYFEDGEEIFIGNELDGSFIKDYIYDPTIIEELVTSGVIRYSALSADLYSLPKCYARDLEYHKNDYKRSKNKELILNNMRDGNFRGYKII